MSVSIAEHQKDCERNFIAWTFFAINLAVVIALVVVSVTCIASPTPAAPFAFVGGWLILPVATIYGLKEYQSAFRPDQSRRLFRLGVVNLCAAGFMAFGFVANVGEAIVYGSSKTFIFWLIFAAIFGSIIAYLAVCGAYRIRRARATVRTLS